VEEGRGVRLRNAGRRDNKEGADGGSGWVGRWGKGRGCGGSCVAMQCGIQTIMRGSVTC
jgi:hypothetical protein